MILGQVSNDSWLVCLLLFKIHASHVVTHAGAGYANNLQSHRMPEEQSFGGLPARHAPLPTMGEDTPPHDYGTYHGLHKE